MADPNQRLRNAETQARHLAERPTWTYATDWIHPFLAEYDRRGAENTALRTILKRRIQGEEIDWSAKPLSDAELENAVDAMVAAAIERKIDD